MSKNFKLLWCSTLLLIFNITFAFPNSEGIQVYQKNVHLMPEHKQKLSEDIFRYRNADNLWDVLREEFNLPHYAESYAVQEKIEWYMNNQEFLLRSATRAAPYLYYILQQAKKRHLPAELVLLPIVESGYNPFSLSPVGAAGIWQLMPGTATGLGVKHDSLYDGRRDVIASTRAALNYLGYLQTFFDGNWLLAIGAYNTGEGNVQSAIRRNIRAGRDTDFWSLPLAQETRDFVPRLLALAIIISHPEQYPIYFPPVRNAPYLAQVDVGVRLNLQYAASLAGISYKKMQQLNPGFNPSVHPSKGPLHKLVLPIENVEQFTENLARSPVYKQPINWLHYDVKTGDTLASISKKFNTTPAILRKLNRLTKNSLRKGSEILIPHEGPINETKLAAKESTWQHTKPSKKYILQPGDTIYMVRNKDTLQGIAKRFRITTVSLQAANAVNAKKLKPGIQIIIPTHQKMLAKKTTATPFSANKKLQAGDTVYLVRRGDTVEKIAKKFRTSPAVIRLTNLVDNTTLAEGERLVIPAQFKG